MGHGYDIRCCWCAVKFCQCHEYTMLNEEVFCSQECLDEYAKEYANELKKPS